MKNIKAPGCDHLGFAVNNLNKFGRIPLGDNTYQTSKL